jgi:hypothetical protein
VSEVTSLLEALLFAASSAVSSAADEIERQAAEAL